MNLKDKVVVIVGGSQGFGRALAEGFVAEQSKVVIVSRKKELVEKTANEIGAKAYVADVRVEQELRDISDAVIKEFGSITIWINSAGQFKKFPQIDLLDMERAHEMFDVNFFGAVLGSRTALLHMQNGGIILNVLSSAALDASRAIGAKLYASSKWALRGYVDALRGENADNPVKILSVYPGDMKTHLHYEASPDAFNDFMEPRYVVEKVIANLKLDSPELDLIVKRPSV